jgi:predicted GNAT superfamily acetyltransferase
MPVHDDVVIEPVRDGAGYRACERLQKEVWGFNDIAVIPDHLIHMVTSAGGLLLGAFDGIGPGREMVGFTLSVVGVLDGPTLRHHSLMAAVAPGWQDKGVGYGLKCAQRDHVLAQGIKTITWTFDPLESRNAYFNLNKLGVVVAQYVPNYFGELRDARNRGMDTDRFLCQWRLDSPRVKSYLGGGKPPALALGDVDTINRSQRTAAGFRSPAGSRLGLRAGHLLFEIPSDLQTMRKADLDLAREWRLESRRALSTYMDEGYLVTSLFREGDRSFLVLERSPLATVLERP